MIRRFLVKFSPRGRLLIWVLKKENLNEYPRNIERERERESRRCLVKNL